MHLPFPTRWLALASVALAATGCGGGDDDNAPPQLGAASGTNSTNNTLPQLATAAGATLSSCSALTSFVYGNTTVNSNGCIAVRIRKNASSRRTTVTSRRRNAHTTARALGTTGTGAVIRVSSPSSR